MTAFYNSADFGFVAPLEGSFELVLTELSALPAAAFLESPDSLTTISNGYNETGWRYFNLFGPAAECETNRALCPNTTRTCAAVPGLINAGFSMLQPGTHLYPHHGELPGVLRCHLPLVVPAGDQGIKIGSETRSWERGRCLIFDDTFEHTAWNHGESDRIVLLVTFEHNGV